ncbi:hypothetical protein MKW92_025971 [Papaver armeniacum]|nr:hypothetical protein MKW92_025971 [Papaver armeniacum]
MFDYTKTDIYLIRLKEAKERRRLRRALVGKNSDTDTTDDNWIDMHFINLTPRLEYHKKQIIYPRFEIKEPSIDLESSLKMFFQEAACDADDWTDVNRRCNDRRSFPAFLFQIAPSGLDKYASNEDNDINIGYQPNTWSYIEASPDDLDKFYNGSFLNLMKLPQRIRRESHRSLKLMLMKPSQTYAMVVTDKYNGGCMSLDKLLHDNVIADKHYGGCLSLKELLQRIRSQSGDDFRRGQARLLESFLDHLIKIQQEQRFVAKSFSEHLEQLRKSTLKDSYFSSPSSIKESNKILDIILVYISKFKKSKDLLDQYLHDESFRRYVDPKRLVMYTKEKLDAFREHVKYLQGQGVERKSAAETLLGCFVDVVNMNHRGGNPSEAAKKTSELINEAVEKLISVKCCALTSGGSPLGCIALWRILFESSLINLRLDLICENHDEAIKLGATDGQLDQIRLSIDKLLTVGESVLVEFIAMHKTVAEVTYMLGDAFTTGGAGMRGLSDVTHLENFNFDDFPWDKHNLPPRIDNTMNWREYCEDDKYDV